MAYCYRIPYRDRYGDHVAVKWGNSPADAAGLLGSALANRGSGTAEIGPPEFMRPQPFGDCEPPSAAMVANTELSTTSEPEVLALI